MCSESYIEEFWVGTFSSDYVHKYIHNMGAHGLKRKFWIQKEQEGMIQAFKKETLLSPFLEGGKWYSSGRAGVNRHPSINSLTSNSRAWTSDL